jgi:hypothetical protein
MKSIKLPCCIRIKSFGLWIYQACKTNLLSCKHGLTLQEPSHKDNCFIFILKRNFDENSVVEIDNKLIANFPTVLFAKYKFGMKTTREHTPNHKTRNYTWFGQYCLHPPTREFHYEQILTTHSTCPYHPITLCSQRKASYTPLNK